jgi:hypothetical protein
MGIVQIDHTCRESLRQSFHHQCGEENDAHQRRNNKTEEENGAVNKYLHFPLHYFFDARPAFFHRYFVLSGCKVRHYGRYWKGMYKVWIGQNNENEEK